jgi:hypothetical protein
MPMPSYPILCQRPGCGKPALYKIAAQWSDGITEDLKTYALACAECLSDLFTRSCAKKTACRVAQGETLVGPHIYVLARGTRDRHLQRRQDLEQSAAGAI